MPTLRQISIISAFIFALLSTAIAQESPSASVQRSSLTITAAAAGERVRITAPSSIVQMRVEVFAASGEKLFDQETRGGNVFDWHLQDGQAQRLAPGNYVCVVTAKSISGRITQKIGTVNIEEKSVSVQPAESPQLSVPQTQAIGPVEENSSWTIAAKDEPQTGTVIANDGTDGQMIRGRGALTFRIGDFFSGVDKEQMRLTEDGKLGIGTSEPKATLDVAGTIRAERFLMARPKLAGVDKTDTLAADAVDSVQPLVAGTGTPNRIAKWIDNAGTLGDSGITENNAGFVGIGTSSPGSKLVVSSNTATLPAASGIARFADADGVQTAVFADAFGTNPIFNVRRANGTAAVPSALQTDQLLGVIGASGFGTSTYSGTRARVAFWASEMWTDSANGTYLTFNTTANGAATAGGTERVRIDNAGNVGIGTSNPTNGKLHVSSSSGTAVYGASSIATGVYGSSSSPSGYGVIGSSSNYGVGGSSSSGVGVRAQSDSGVGLRAESVSGNLIEGYDGFSSRKFFFANDGTLNLPAGGLVAGTNQLVLYGSNVGIGTTTPTNGRLEVIAFSGQRGVVGQSDDITGVKGESNSGIGVAGQSTSGPGLFARTATGNLVEGYVGPSTRRFHITNDGTYVAGSDFAEALPARGDKTAYEPGDVLVVSTKSPGKVEKASRAYDPRVAGIYSTRPGMLGADKNGSSRVDKDEVPVAIVGIVPTKVSAMNGRIRVGDLLTTSSTPGYAMRCASRLKCVGAIVGKALEPMAEAKGVIKVLVMLR